MCGRSSKCFSPTTCATSAGNLGVATRLPRPPDLAQFRNAVKPAVEYSEHPISAPATLCVTFPRESCSQHCPNNTAKERNDAKKVRQQAVRNACQPPRYAREEGPTPPDEASRRILNQAPRRDDPRNGRGIAASLFDVFSATGGSLTSGPPRRSAGSAAYSTLALSASFFAGFECFLPRHCSSLFLRTVFL